MGTDADAETVTRFIQDPDINRWTTIPRGQNERQTRDWMQRTTAGLATGTDLALVITMVSSDEPIGTIGLHEIHPFAQRAVCGYVVAADARGRQVAQRSMRLICAFAFDELRLSRVEAAIDPANAASRAAAEAAGFREEGLMRSYMTIDGRRRDLLMYSILPGEITPPPAATLEG